MDHQARNAARTLLVNFTRIALAGEVPTAPADEDAYQRVAESLTRAPVFLASAVRGWDESERRALFEMLAAAIVALRAPAAVTRDDLGGSTPYAVGLRFARWLATRQSRHTMPRRLAPGVRFAFAGAMPAAELSPSR
jgi:hypothetical protein